MTRSRLPLVSDNHVLELDGIGDQLAPVVVGTDAWFIWLADQHIQSFSFRNPLGTFTVRNGIAGTGMLTASVRASCAKPISARPRR